MLSMPPDSTIPAEPAWMMSCASMVAFMPEPQTLLTVVAPVASGSPAPRAACRAGAWPCPAGSTLPMKTSSMRSGASFARSSAAPITCAPSLWALRGDNSPMKRPSGVRAAETMTTGSEAPAMANSPVDRFFYLTIVIKIAGIAMKCCRDHQGSAVPELLGGDGTVWTADHLRTLHGVAMRYVEDHR